MKIRSPKIKANEWFTDELVKLRAKVRKLYMKAMKSKRPLARQHYREEQRRFKKKCKKAKIKSWRYFVETTPNENRMAVLNLSLIHI